MDPHHEDRVHDASEYFVPCRQTEKIEISSCSSREPSLVFEDFQMMLMQYRDRAISTQSGEQEYRIE